jgi:ubiquitin-protein ligase E3 C
LLIQHILTLPLLPNRLPLPSLTQFSANLPLHAASVLSPSISQLVSDLGVEKRVHLLANIAAFVPPRYATLSSASLATLLHLSATAMSSLPSGALEPKSSASIGKQIAESESDSDSEDPAQLSVSLVTPVSLHRLDERTLKRLQTLTTPTHINSLIRATQSHTETRVALCDFLFALCSVSSLRIYSVLGTIIVSTGGGLVRELYRGYVRSSPLGKEVGLATLLGMSSLNLLFAS